MKPLKRLTDNPAMLAVLTVVLLFAAIEFGLADYNKMEIGTAVYKMMIPPGNYHPVKNPADHYVLLVIQKREQKGYFFDVPRQYFRETNIGDKIPLNKTIGYLTGTEYKREIIINGK